MSSTNNSKYAHDPEIDSDEIPLGRDFYILLPFTTKAITFEIIHKLKDYITREQQMISWLNRDLDQTTFFKTYLPHDVDNTLRRKCTPIDHNILSMQFIYSQLAIEDRYPHILEDEFEYAFVAMENNMTGSLACCMCLHNNPQYLISIVPGEYNTRVDKCFIVPICYEDLHKEILENQKILDADRGRDSKMWDVLIDQILNRLPPALGT
jgi:hypothetical protein